MGKVEKVDVGENGVNLGCFLRIRVTLNISQPLIRGRMVRMGGSDSRWVEFKYERLPVFCYLCGRLDHDEKDCIEWIRRAVPLKAEDKQYGPWLRAIPDRLQKTHMVTGMQAGEKAKTGQMGSEKADGVKQSDKHAGTSVECHQPKGDEETNGKRDDVESLLLQNEKFKKKLTKEMEKSVFEEQLREIDVEIFGKADREGNVQMAPKVRILESEKMMPANREEEVRNNGPAHMGFGPPSSGPLEEMGSSKDLLGPVGINVPLDQENGKQGFHGGPKLPVVKEDGITRNTKGPIREKPQKHACKPGKENMGKNTSKLQKANDMRELTRMETEEVEMGPKRKSRTPLEDIMENAGVGKKPKLEKEVSAFGKLLAKQMGSVVAAV